MSVVVLEETQLAEIARQAAVFAVSNLREDLEKSHTREIMTKAQVAEYLQCSISTINYQIQRNGLPVERLGDTPRFRKSDIDIWMRTK